MFNKIQSVLGGMLGALIILLVMEWITPEPKIIATVDITKLTQDFIKTERSKNLSDDLLKKEAAIFGRQLEKKIKLLAKNNNLILLPLEAVMTGSKDYTHEIAKELGQSYSNEDDPT